MRNFVIYYKYLHRILINKYLNFKINLLKTKICEWHSKVINFVNVIN